MYSATKRQLMDNVIHRMAQRAFPQKSVVSIKEMTGGYFNNTCLVTFEDGFKTVLKVAPDPKVKVQRYEHNLMDSEVTVLKQLSSVQGLTSPEVLYHDISHDIIDSPYMFMTYLPGTPLDRLRESIDENTYSDISCQLAEHMKQIQQHQGDFFGFINNCDRQYTDWYSCFLAMVQDLFDDATDVGLTLPIARNEAVRLISNNKESLDDVKSPSLIHKDLWDGNVFVDEATLTISGIIDCERALYGDPIMDLVCAHQQNNPVFIQAFTQAGSFSDSEAIRIMLYAFYLYLLVYIEVPYRKYSDSGMETWSKKMLEETIAALKKLK